MRCGAGSSLPFTAPTTCSTHFSSHRYHHRKVPLNPAGGQLHSTTLSPPPQQTQTMNPNGTAHCTPYFSRHIPVHVVTRGESRINRCPGRAGCSYPFCAFISPPRAWPSAGPLPKRNPFSTTPAGRGKVTASVTAAHGWMFPS
jgi:hypothetical protein